MAISSAGEHYGGKDNKNDAKYKNTLLHKSHKAYGFIEPQSFVPSIGISEIAIIAKNKYVVSSLKDNSLYFLNLEIINYKFKKSWYMKELET